MSVYIDQLFSYTPRTGHARRWGRRWCHMWADTVEELVEFAQALSLERRYLQYSSVIHHFDLVPSKRREAIKKGAIEMSLKEYLRRRNAEGTQSSQAAER